MAKIYSLDDLKIVIAKQKKDRKIIVHCHGVFDLLHIGHIKHFKKAKKLGDKLVVTITPDKYVNKGPGRPVFSQDLRCEAVASIDCVDYVAINETPTAAYSIKKIKPNIYCKGKDYKNLKDDITGEIKNEIKELKKVNGKIYFTEEATFSSSQLINESTNFYSKNKKKIIEKIKQKYDFKQIKMLIDKFSELKILLIGETIIDEYNFCEAIGKSGKDPILVLKDLKSERYYGGILNIALNLSEFNKKITILSAIGENKGFLKEIKKNLSKNIKTNFLNIKNKNTILKKRYVDNISKNKIIGVYDLNDEPLKKDDEEKFLKLLNKLTKQNDLVVVSDYGHGLISKKAANLICKNSKFLALNAQINSSNIGFHTIRNYKNFNTLIINEKELRHEMREKSMKLETLMIKLSINKNIKNLIVTRGNNGSIMYNNKKFYYVDAFAKNIIDKTGAGDTMLSLVGPCLKNKFDSNLTLLIGSLAAAQSVETIGNKYPINKIKILKNLENILK